MFGRLWLGPGTVWLCQGRTDAGPWALWPPRAQDVEPPSRGLLQPPYLQPPDFYCTEGVMRRQL